VPALRSGAVRWPVHRLSGAGLVTDREKVLAIIDAAPTLIRVHGIHAFYCLHGGHGLPVPSSMDRAGQVMLDLSREGVLERVGRRPARYRRPRS
jgi:hypothetical protein